MSWSKGASPWGERSPPSVFLTANSQRSCPAGAKVLIGGRRLCQLARPNFGRVILDGKGAWERVLVIRDPEGREVRGSVDPRMPGRGRPADKAWRVSEAVAKTYGKRRPTTLYPKINHRSHSPKTMSMDPKIVTTSPTMWPGRSFETMLRLTNDGARILRR